MAKQNRDEVAFTVSLDSSEDLSVKTISDTLRDIDSLLEDIEMRVLFSSEGKVNWTWPEDAQLSVVAHVNGVSRPQLSRIVAEAQMGFAEAKNAKGAVNWPASFGEKAKQSANNILKRLGNLESITIKAEDQKPLKITSAQITESVVAQGRKTVTAYSSIEGELDLISHRNSLRAAITEHGTGTVVQIKFDDEKLDAVKNHFKKRVVAEGTVKYRADGTPISMTLSSIRERKIGRPLIEFLGAAPDLAGGMSPEEFITKVRKDA